MLRIYERRALKSLTHVITYDSFILNREDFNRENILHLEYFDSFMDSIFYDLIIRDIKKERNTFLHWILLTIAPPIFEIIINEIICVSNGTRVCHK